MDKFWENYIKTRPADSKGAFDEFRKMNQEPRNMKLARVDDDIPDAFNPYLEQSEFLKPGETLEDWQPNPFLKPHADGGQVVIGKPGGLVEPGIEYYGKKKIATEGMSRALKWYHEKGKFIRSFQPKTITINKKPLKVTVTKFKQTDADAITKGLKQIEQWKKNPTKQNWVDIFRNPDTGQSSDFSKNVMSDLLSFFFIFSASSIFVFKSKEISFVICFPPTGNIL